MEEAIKDRLQIMAEAYSSSSLSEERNGNVNKTFEKSLITELILDGYSIQSIKEDEENILNAYPNLAKLTMNQTELKTLKNFPYSNTIKILELTDNFIQNDLHILCEKIPNIQKLELGGNHIKNFEEIEKLKKLTDLIELGLDLNPISSEKDFKQKVWQIFPKLNILDGCDREGNEVEFNTEEEEAQEAESDDETTLKGFYEKEYNEEDDEDDEDFAPDGEEEEDSEIEDEEDENEGGEDGGVIGEEDDEEGEEEEDDENEGGEEDDGGEEEDDEEEERDEDVLLNKRKTENISDQEERKKSKLN